MRRILMVLFGTILGGGIGAVVMAFFAPKSREVLQAHLDHAMLVAREASATRRRELENELAGQEQSGG